MDTSEGMETSVKVSAHPEFHSLSALKTATRVFAPERERELEEFINIGLPENQTLKLCFNFLPVEDILAAGAETLNQFIKTCGDVGFSHDIPHITRGEEAFEGVFAEARSIAFDRVAEGTEKLITQLGVNIFVNNFGNPFYEKNKSSCTKFVRKMLSSISFAPYITAQTEHRWTKIVNLFEAMDELAIDAWALFPDDKGNSLYF